MKLASVIGCLTSFLLIDLTGCSLQPSVRSNPWENSPETNAILPRWDEVNIPQSSVEDPTPDPSIINTHNNTGNSDNQPQQSDTAESDKVIIAAAKRRDRQKASALSPPFIWPLKNLEISSGFNSRWGRHQGIDLRAPRGTQILAAADGIVQFVGRQRGYGNMIIIQHTDNIKTLYAHNQQHFVKRGQKVTRGEVIATVGKTGNATGYHVHFEYIKTGKRLDPSQHIGAVKKRS